MGLINISADFHQIVSLLTRIADALERAYPPAMLPSEEKPRGIESLSRQTPAQRARREQERKEKERQENAR